MARYRIGQGMTHIAPTQALMELWGFPERRSLADDLRHDYFARCALAEHARYNDCYADPIAHLAQINSRRIDHEILGYERRASPDYVSPHFARVVKNFLQPIDALNGWEELELRICGLSADWLADCVRHQQIGRGIFLPVICESAAIAKFLRQLNAMYDMTGHRYT